LDSLPSGDVSIVLDTPVHLANDVGSNMLKFLLVGDGLTETIAMAVRIEGHGTWIVLALCCRARLCVALRWRVGGVPRNFGGNAGASQVIL